MDIFSYRLFLTTLSKVQICELDIKDLEITDFLSEADEISFPMDRFLNGISHTEDTRFDLVKNLYWILLEKYSGDTYISSKYYSIIEPVQNYTNGQVELNVKCLSTDYQEFNRRRIRGYDEASVTLSQALTYVASALLSGTWTIGTLPAKATTEYHTITATEDTVTSFFQMLSLNWDVIIIPDTYLNVINAYDKATYGTNTDVVLSSKNFVNSASLSPKMDQLITRLYVYGKDGISISSVNPIGTSYVDDFTYFIDAGYFSTGLDSAYSTYLVKVASYGSSFASLLANLSTYQSDLLSIENDLVNLNTQKVIYDNAMSVYQSANKKNTAGYDAVYANWVINNGLIVSKEIDKTNKEGQITSTLSSIQSITTDLAYSNPANFSTLQLQELSKYIYENTLNVDTLSEPSVLYDYGVAYITAKNQPVYEIDIDSADLFAIAEAQGIRESINVGDYLWLNLEEVSLDFIAVQLVSYTHNPFSNKLTFKLSNSFKLESNLYYLNDVFKKANTTSLEVQNNAPAWGEYVLDKPNILTDTSEIDAEKNIIRAGLGNTIDHRGFTGTDIGSDPNSHLKLLDDKIVLSKDEWETFHTILSSDGVYFSNSENTSRVVITPSTGIQIDKNVASTPLSTENWDNRFYADTNGDLFIEGNIFVGDSTENIVIDRFGLNPSYNIWYKNMLPNSDAMVAQTPPIVDINDEFIPWMFTGCLSTRGATFRAERSFKVAIGDTMTNVPAFGGANINPTWLPTGTKYMRFSLWTKFGIASVKIKDETNSNYFSLAQASTPTITSGNNTIIFDANDNWYANPDSLWFDLTETGHTGCDDIRIEITNTHGSEALYVSAPMITIDRTGSWAQGYISGPYATATSDGSTVDGGGLDTTGGGGTIGNLYVETAFPTNAANKSVLVDTDDYTRVNLKTITTAKNLLITDIENIEISVTSTIRQFDLTTVVGGSDYIGVLFSEIK
ncbi:MAG: hypothetical protein D4S01_09040, partial [Dehalococcoidia bacterium]